MGAAMLALTACSKEPINLAPGFAPSGDTSWSQPRGHGAHDAPPPQTCRIHFGDIVDKRADKDSMGLLGWRVVHGTDTVGWLRSGLATLKRDSRIEIADSADGTDLDMSVDLLKAYIINITTDKSANVVVRVHYSRNGVAAGDQVIRGVETGWNWANGTDETQSAFDDALDDLLRALDRDIQSRCAPAATSAQAP